ncbi:MAG: hypothetical protein F6K42_00545 [Leptolyngbya sp. SIO1D8]|nr:hypothetical protein [Leptolyngbya sp. SIO1D8]
MEAIQEKSYSISRASQALNKSEGSIKNYKKLVLEAFQKNTSLVVFGNGSLTEIGFQQLSKAAHFISKGERDNYKKAVFQAFPELEFDISVPGQSAQAVSGSADYTGIVRGGSLVKRRSTAITNSFSEFDQASADGELALIQEDITTQVENLDGLFSRYARARVQKAFTEIDHTVEALKANALAEMGVEATAPKQ